jgi:hypothetical protein
MKKRWVLAVTVLVAVAISVEPVASQSVNGRAGTMSAYYDGQLFTINFKELSSNAEMAVLRSNHSINIIYMCDACGMNLPGNKAFVSVINAIQGDGFNPLWQEVQIIFNDGFLPRQLTSDNSILAAAAAREIMLIPTNQVYRCAVVGPVK